VWRWLRLFRNVSHHAQAAAVLGKERLPA